MGGGSGCETTASTGSSPLPNSLLSHCSHGGNSFTAETFVNDDRDSGRRLRRWPERPSLTKVSAVKHAPPCETMDHTRPFQLSLVSRSRGPRFLPENRPGRMLLKLLSPILHLLPVGGPINELVNLHNCEGAQRRINPDRAHDSLHLYSFSRHKQNNPYRSRCGPVWIASSLRSLAMTAAVKPHAAAGTSTPALPSPENAPPAGRRISSPRRSAP